MFSTNSFGLLISGGRGFKDYKSFVTKVENLLSNVPQWDIHIITGDSEGTDEMARRYAVEFGCELHTFSTMWHEHDGKAVGERNVSMFKFLVQNFHHLGVLIMCDGEFNSEEQQINLSKYWKLPTRIHRNHALEFGGIKDLPEPEFVSAPKWFQDEENLSSYDKFLLKYEAELKQNYNPAMTNYYKSLPKEEAEWKIRNTINSRYDDESSRSVYLDETDYERKVRLTKRHRLLRRAAHFADIYGVWADKDVEESEVWE